MAKHHIKNGRDDIVHQDKMVERGSWGEIALNLFVTKTNMTKVKSIRRSVLNVLLMPSSSF